MTASKKRILVVEDEVLIAILIQQLLVELGYECVGPVKRLSDALKVAATGTFDGAILNLILDGEHAYAVAEVLEAKGVPFGFATLEPITSNFEIADRVDIGCRVEGGVEHEAVLARVA